MSSRMSGDMSQPSPEVAVTFTPSGRRGRVSAGTTVLDAARGLGVDLDSVCGGRGICGRCQVTVGSRPGVPADPTRLSASGSTEDDYTRRPAGRRRPLVDGRRLGCATAILDEVVIDVPPDSQVHRQVVRKEVGDLAVTLDPVVRLHYVVVPEATLDDRRGDLERLRVVLGDDWELHDLAVDTAALARLQPALAAGDRAVTVAVRHGDRVVAIWPGLVDRAWGLAVDVGSTTIAGHLCDLTTGRVLATAGRMNPQIAWGEDLMSRVSHVMMHDDGQVVLTAAVQQALDALARQLCDQAGVDIDRLLEVVAVGNPIMHHLLFGLDPLTLGSAPFALATTQDVTARAAEVGLASLPAGARVWSPPCVAGHVGADAAAMVLADGPHRRDELTLLIDVGTNAEIVLGDRTHVVAASSPTGPAFEGAQISSGQRAAPGAIERVRIDPATLRPRIRVIGVDAWSDEPGFDDGVATTGITGICGSGIIEAIAELHLAGVVAVDGTIVDPTGTGADGRLVADGRTLAYRLWDDPVVEVTQNDVRAIQLAKAALQAGCRLLMAHAGVDSVDRIRLAGAFGSHIDPLRAMVLGLVPDCDPDRVESIGNAAGAGAVLALLSATARREVIDVTGRIAKVETATEPSFQEQFVGAMAFPHASAPYPHLEAVVDLPRRTAEPRPATRASRDGRRRRRSSPPTPTVPAPTVPTPAAPTPTPTTSADPTPSQRQD